MLILKEKYFQVKFLKLNLLILIIAFQSTLIKEYQRNLFLLIHQLLQSYLK
jgi:hypothetical protein